MAHAGFDTSIYPGDALMSALKAQTNLVWCGFYLAPAPSHPNASWMNRRQHLVDEGWGLAPVYVGQQEAGPGSHEVSESRGETDGADACSLAISAGFPVGSVIYLDLEKGGPISGAAAHYLAAWARCVKNGQFKPGVYCSHTSAATALSTVPDLTLWVFRVLKSNVGATKVSPFSEDSPSLNDAPSASVLQYAQNCTINILGRKVLVDLDTASGPDPSSSI